MRKLLKGQIWYFDLVIALALFTLIIILSFKYISETFMFQGTDILEEAKKFSDTLLSEGIPKNWNSSIVKSIGLRTNNSLDITKLSTLNNMTQSDYDNIKELSSLKYDFLILFEEDKVTDITHVGYPGYNYSDIIAMDTEELIEITRYVTYRHDGIAEIISMKLVMWDSK